MVKEKFSGVFQTLVATLKQQTHTVQTKIKQQQQRPPAPQESQPAPHETRDGHHQEDSARHLKPLHYQEKTFFELTKHVMQIGHLMQGKVFAPAEYLVAFEKIELSFSSLAEILNGPRGRKIVSRPDSQTLSFLFEQTCKLHVLI